MWFFVMFPVGQRRLLVTSFVESRGDVDCMRVLGVATCHRVICLVNLQILLRSLLVDRFVVPQEETVDTLVKLLAIL